MRAIALTLTYLALLWTTLLAFVDIQQPGQGIALGLATSSPWLAFAWLCAWADSRRCQPWHWTLKLFVAALHVAMPFLTLVLFLFLTFSPH